MWHIYIYDIIFWSPDEFNIDTTISELKRLKFDLTHEGDVHSFLGVKLDTTEDDTIAMLQPALIDVIIQALGLEETPNPTSNPCSISTNSQIWRHREISWSLELYISSSYAHILSEKY